MLKGCEEYVRFSYIFTLNLKIPTWLYDGLPVGAHENIAMVLGKILTFNEDVIIVRSLK